jgi:hypothetical protein
MVAVEGFSEIQEREEKMRAKPRAQTNVIHTFHRHIFKRQNRFSRRFEEKIHNSCGKDLHNTTGQIMEFHIGLGAGAGRKVGRKRSGSADKIRPTSDPNFRPEVGEKVRPTLLIFELKYYITSRIVDPCDRLLKEYQYKWRKGLKVNKNGTFPSLCSPQELCCHNTHHELFSSRGDFSIQCFRE